MDELTSEATVEIKNADGLHMRPAMQFIDLASTFESEITVDNGEAEVDGKSIMGMATLKAIYGTKLKIKARGSDAFEAIDALKELVEVKMFDEPPPKKTKSAAS